MDVTLVAPVEITALQVVVPQIALFWTSICTGARRNPAACGTHPTVRQRRFNPVLRAGRCAGGSVRESAFASGARTPAWDQIAFVELLDLYRSALEFGDLQCKPGVLKTTIWYGRCAGGSGRESTFASELRTSHSRGLRSLPRRPPLPTPIPRLAYHSLPPSDLHRGLGISLL